MKALLDEDVIVKVWRKGTNIGSVPRGVGWERLRFDHRIGKVVDLMDLTEMHVRYKGGGFGLHAVPVPNSQLISMRYHDRHKLVMTVVNAVKVISLLSDEEYEQIQTDKAANILDNKQLRTRLINLVSNVTYSEVTSKVDNIFSDHTPGQRQVLKDALHVLLYLAKKELRK